MADEALAHADYVARGEGGEQLMLELIDALQGGRARMHPGLSYGKDGQRCTTRCATLVVDLDTLPFPDLLLIVGNEQASAPRRS